jgi:hypothetical protein
MTSDPSGRGARPLRRRDAAAREVPVPAPFSLEEFRAGVESWRGRPLALAAGRLAPGRAAAWIATATADFIVYDRDAPFPGQVRAIAHQVAHMLLGHRGSPDGRDAAGALFPDLDPAAVDADLGAPAAFTAAEEQDADALARSLLARIARALPGGLPPGS